MNIFSNSFFSGRLRWLDIKDHKQLRCQSGRAILAKFETASVADPDPHIMYLGRSASYIICISKCYAIYIFNSLYKFDTNTNVEVWAAGQEPRGACLQI